jgi:holliday junction DNA helicase RuvB
MDEKPARLLNPEPQPDDRLDLALRPRTLTDLIGQERVKENLAILILAARQRGDPLDHVLFYGPPGLGKTTLAHVLANEMSVNIKVTSGPAIERPGDLAAILTNLRAGDILFIDEVHRLGRAVEEVLYPAMEDYALDIVIGKGPSARSIRLKLPRFTVIGATTRLALLTAPLRSRFGAVYHLDFYDIEAMRLIVSRACHTLSVQTDIEGVDEIAQRGRGTPRVALRLLRRVRDFAQVRADGTITRKIARDALDLLNVDLMGLDELDRRVLTTVIEKYRGGPVGLSTIAASISEEPDTIMDVVEPYLLQLGYLERTSHGRVATALAYEHLGIERPPDGQTKLF